MDNYKPIVPIHKLVREGGGRELMPGDMVVSLTGAHYELLGWSATQVFVKRGLQEKLTMQPYTIKAEIITIQPRRKLGS